MVLKNKERVQKCLNGNAQIQEGEHYNTALYHSYVVVKTLLSLMLVGQIPLTASGFPCLKVKVIDRNFLSQGCARQPRVQ